MRLKGPNFNGNHFAKQALEEGAAFVFVDEKISFTDKRIIQTEDVLKHFSSLQNFIAVTISDQFLLLRLPEAMEKQLPKN